MDAVTCIPNQLTHHLGSRHDLLDMRTGPQQGAGTDAPALDVGESTNNWLLCIHEVVDIVCPGAGVLRACRIMARESVIRTSSLVVVGVLGCNVDSIRMVGTSG